MKQHAGIYWSLCLSAAMAVVMAHPLASAAPQNPPPAMAPPQDATPQDATPLDEARVEAIVKSEILALGVPSVSVAVMRGGQMLLERAWGLSDVDKHVEAASATPYPVGSVTKQFTAALLLKQVERGRLALTDPIGRHFADLPGETASITIEQLLNHTSGLKRAIADEKTRFEIMSPASLLAKAVRDEPEAKPGTEFVYSNAGYTILGVLVEKLYGKPYAEVLSDEIAGPLQLTTLRKCGEPDPGDARGYIRAQVGKPGEPPGLHHSQELGAGGICASAADLVRWTHALHTGRVLSPATYEAMITPRGAAAASHYGFGLSAGPAAWGGKAIVHGGQSLTGHVAELNWYPEQSLAVALLYNAYPRVPGVSDIVPRLVLGVPLAVPATAPLSVATPADRSKLVGVYQLAPGRTFEVTLEKGELHVTPPGGGKQQLMFRSGNAYGLGSSDSTTIITFFVENGVATAFEANNNGIKRTLKKIK